jgi:protein-tyrosine-phosphatase
MPSASKLRVLFVCFGNACRSPMAESIARHHASDVLEPSSAGLYPLGRIATLTEQTLLANNYPIVHLHSKPLTREALEDADLIINLSGVPLDRHMNDLPDTCAKLEHWNVEDPYGEDPATYQRILEEIESRVLLLAARLRAQQRKTTA